MHKIIGDSSVELNAQIEKELSITKIPFTSEIDGTSYIDTGIKAADFLKIMKATSTTPKTAAPSPGAFLAGIEAGVDNYIVTISDALSATYANAKLAANMAPEGTCVHVFNSKSAVAGETVVALLANKLAASGKDFDEVVREVEDFISHKLQTFFVLENLDNLVKNGRMSVLKGKIASFLSIAPIFCGKDGKIELVESVRGIKKSLSRMLELIGTRCEDFEERTLIVAHCNNPERGESVASAARECYPFGRIEVVDMGMLSSIYANDGGIVIAF